jgi:hypothetical protein
VRSHPEVGVGVAVGVGVVPASAEVAKANSAPATSRLQLEFITNLLFRILEIGSL